MTGPKQLERDDNHFDVTVEAKYTFGEDVDGRVKINATLTSFTRKESFVIHKSTANLVWDANNIKRNIQVVLIKSG